MKKIWVILKSEFMRRVLSKWFLISTVLGPLLLIGLSVGSGLLTVLALETTSYRIAVLDDTGVLLPRIARAADEQFELSAAQVPPDSLRRAVQAGAITAYLHLPRGLERGEGEAAYYSEAGGGLTTQQRVSELVNQAVEAERLEAAGAPQQVLDILRSDVPLRMVKLTDEGESEDSSIAFSIIGYVLGFMMYMVMFIYGSFVMQGVIEEKSSRVVEVMISSVRPFELMMGKVLGIGAMGLLQMVLWSVLIMVGISLSGGIIGLFIDPATLNLPAGASQQEVLSAANISIPSVSPMIFVWFVLFFLGGYLLYSSLFAALGSAVEQPQEAQGLMFPVTMLILVPIIFMGFMIENPNAPLSVVFSMIPFFSPILMVVRATVSDVPLWQILASLALLVAAFVGSIWLSGRIYRVGILMYGKKAGFGDLLRWIRYA